MIMKLPNWVLVNKFPAFNDLESLTAIEQTARIYGKINELIESYNKYVEEINKIIEDYELDKYKEVNDFICRISCLTSNYINTVDIKIAHQDRQIAEVYERFTTDIINTFKLFISDLKSSGELDNAIYEAIDNLDETVNKFIDDANKLISDLQEDYQNTKSQLDSDYQNTKSQLDTDYQNTKSQLDTDYTEKKTALDTDYQDTKASLMNDYTEAKQELSNGVQGYVDIYQNRDRLLLSVGDRNLIGLEIDQISRYFMVIVEINDEDVGLTKIPCTVDISGNTFKISGSNTLNKRQDVTQNEILENVVVTINGTMNDGITGTITDFKASQWGFMPASAGDNINVGYYKDLELMLARIIGII